MSILTLERPTRRMLVSCLLPTLLGLAGCSLRHYRTKADRAAYHAVSQKSTDPRWDQPNFTIELDPRSRYYDPADPDCPPMPPDDPASHEFMQVVDCMKAWKHWDKCGFRQELENPCWRERLGEYVELTPDGKVKLDLDTALRLAYMHSTDYQEQLETLYLSALDLTSERFRLDTQFFGGNTTVFDHLGRLRGPGGETNTLRTDTDFQIRRNFATAGELLIGFANSFVWQFAGPDTNSALSIANFNLIQPLLRGGGRVIALERLTRVERGLLANLRQLERYRHGFYTQAAIGNSGVGGVRRQGGFTGGTGLTGFSGTGAGGFGGVGTATGFGGGFFGAGGAGGGAGIATGLAGGGAGQVGGFIGLLQAQQEIGNTQNSLDLQLRTLALLEANLEAGLIDLTQVDQFRQSIQTLRANLLQARNGLQSRLDSYKTGTLALPPYLEIELDDSRIAAFQFINPDITHLQNRIAQFQDEIGALPAEPNVEALAGAVDQAGTFLSDLGQQFDVARQDLQKMEEQAPVRLRQMAPEERRLFDRDMKQLVDELQQREIAFSQLEQDLQQLRDGLDPNTLEQTVKQGVGWIRRLTDEVSAMTLVQARARLEAVALDPLQLEPPEALNIARANRLDYMNNRAALVDSWRLIAFNANDLRSVLDVELSGDVRTVGDNPLDFRGPTGTLRARLEFDAPFTRLLERNNYRQALVDYQQARRQLIQFDDGISQSLRQNLRDLDQLAVNLEIQRQAVIISIRRVDFTRSELNAPLPLPVPGQPPPTFGPTAVQNLLSALSDLSNAQNAFMSVWLNYYATRMALMRDLGLMQLDEQGRWIDRPLGEILSQVCAEPIAVPPAVPDDWWDMASPETQSESLPPATPNPPAVPSPNLNQPAPPEARHEQGQPFPPPPPNQHAAAPLRRLPPVESVDPW